MASLPYFSGVHAPPSKDHEPLAFYQTYGVEEYYVLDPDFGRHKGYLRNSAGLLEPITDLFGWVSPRLGIRFELATGKKPPLRILRPDGRPLERYKEIVRQLDEQERLLNAERERAEAEHQRTERLRAQLRALGMEPDA